MPLDEDIIKDFQVESRTVLGELFEIVDGIEDAATSGGAGDADKLLAEFAQKIDRIMGASKTLAMMDPDHKGLSSISSLAEVCKSTGYRAAELKDPHLLPIFAGFWADVLEVVQQLLRAAHDAEKSRQIADGFTSVLQKRLEWLSAKIGQPKPL